MLRAMLVSWALGLLLVAPLGLGQAADDFTLRLASGASPSFDGDGVQAVLLRQVPGEEMVWRVTTEKVRLVGLVDPGDHFAVARLRQVVPEADGALFTEVSSAVEDTEPWARVANLTTSLARPAYRLAFPVNASNGTAVLRLVRDVTPPDFVVGEIEDLRSFGFFIETRTTEHALANLILRPVSGGESVPSPTANAALIQRFPIQGLRAGTEYAFHVEFWDWAGNRARTDEMRVTTPEPPFVPGPVLTSRFPVPDEVLMEPPDAILANFTPTIGSVRVPGDVRLFVDKREVTDRAEMRPDGVRFVPDPPLGPGLHSVGLEVGNSEGGLTVDRWTFTVGSVEEGAPAPAGLFAALVAAATAFAVGGRRGAGAGRVTGRRRT